MCQVTNWDGLFAGMVETSRKYAWTKRHPDGSIARFVSGLEPDAQTATWLLMDEQGSVQASFR